jgi:hypothetical protein
MDIKITKSPFEYIQIDNTYEENEVKLILAELDFYRINNSLVPPLETGSAVVEETKELKKQNKGLFLDRVYFDRNTSPILRFNRKLFWLECPFDELHPCFNALRDANSDSTLISYYENEDKYLSHRDCSVLTSLTYFYKTPKNFSGGDLVFPKFNIALEPLFNRTYIIPGGIDHEVTPVVMDEVSEKEGFGRYCVSNFITFK